jgi:hypothetical protein
MNCEPTSERENKEVMKFLILADQYSLFSLPQTVDLFFTRQGFGMFAWLSYYL